MTTFAFHPLANLFPLLDGAEFAALCSDIAAAGLREPVWVYEDLILDGRNRARACHYLGIECPTRDYEGDDPVGFVVSMNLARRHLEKSQRGMIAARLADMRPGTRTDLGEISPRLGRDQAAALFNVNPTTVSDAHKIQQAGIPELSQAVDAGDLTVSAAVPLTALPLEEQAAALIEARTWANGGKVTATQTRAVVTRKQVVAAVKSRLEAGDTPHDAVAETMLHYDILIPTPALADAICQATDRQVTLAATDGLLHDGRSKAEDAAAAAETTRLFALFRALETLGTLTDIPALAREIPVYSAYRVDQHLQHALCNLTTFRQLWEDRTNDRTGRHTGSL